MGVDSFSAVPFAEFSADPKLSSIDSKDAAVASLLNLAQKKLGTTAIQKLLFLTFAEKKIIIPFSFRKYHYGPYSKQINNHLHHMTKQSLLSAKKEQNYYTQKSYSLTSAGKQVAILREPIRKSMQDILAKYGQDTAVLLEEYCYEAYRLKPKGQSTDSWETSTVADLEQLLQRDNQLLSFFSTYEDIDENKQLFITTSFDYVRSLLEQLKTQVHSLDNVLLGVLAHSCEEFISYWEEIRVALRKKQDLIPHLLKKANLEFKFLNVVAEKEGVHESVFS